MADTKRQSSGSRTSTPKPGNKTAGATGPGEFDLSRAIGARVKVTASNPPITLEGTLYAACPVTNLVAVNTAVATSNAVGNASAQPPGNYHVLPISRIQAFSIVSLPDTPANTEASTSGFENAQPAISRIDIKALKAREEAAIRKIKEKDATRGKGVSKEAQDVFDALARTLPVRWHDTSIIVNDAVLITKPYTPESCSAPKDQQNSLTRVKKVLENERRKIAEKANSKAAAVATPLAVPRKGG